MLRASAEPFEQTWPAVPASVAAIRHAVVDYLQEAELGSAAFDDIRLAISEAVSNAILHGYVGGEPGSIRVRVDEDDDELRIVIEDDGRGMQPRADSPGLGLGMPLIAAVSRRVETHARPGNGTRISMWFEERGPVGAR
jgi:anti-sigma regulatory factor (Ser/Thr protein kinase)